MPFTFRFWHFCFARYLFYSFSGHASARTSNHRDCRHFFPSSFHNLRIHFANDDEDDGVAFTFISIKTLLLFIVAIRTRNLYSETRFPAQNYSPPIHTCTPVTHTTRIANYVRCRRLYFQSEYARNNLYTLCLRDSSCA